MKKFFILWSIVLLTAGTGYALGPGVPLPPGSVGDFAGHIVDSQKPRSNKCGQCKGSGKIIKTEIVWSKLKKRFVKARQSATCPKCHGTGTTMVTN